MDTKTSGCKFKDEQGLSPQTTWRTKRETGARQRRKLVGTAKSKHPKGTLSGTRQSKIFSPLTTRTGPGSKGQHGDHSQQHCLRRSAGAECADLQCSHHRTQMVTVRPDGGQLSLCWWPFCKDTNVSSNQHATHLQLTLCDMSIAGQWNWGENACWLDTLRTSCQKCQYLERQKTAKGRFQLSGTERTRWRPNSTCAARGQGGQNPQGRHTRGRAREPRLPVTPPYKVNRSGFDHQPVLIQFLVLRQYTLKHSSEK